MASKQPTSTKTTKSAQSTGTGTKRPHDDSPPPQLGKNDVGDPKLTALQSSRKAASKGVSKPPVKTSRVDHSTPIKSASGPKNRPLNSSAIHHEGTDTHKIYRSA